MLRWLRKLPRPRLRIRTLLVLVALVAVGLGGWREYWSPKQVWRRAIHSDAKTLYVDVFLWLEVQSNQRIDGLDREATVFEVQRAMSDRNEEIRASAVETFGHLKLGTDRTFREILPIFQDQSALVRVAAIRGLVELGRQGPPRQLLLPPILDRLNDSDSRVRQQAVEALQDFIRIGQGPDGPELTGSTFEVMMKAIVSKLKDTDGEVRVVSACILAYEGRDEGVLPVLFESALKLEGWRSNYWGFFHAPSALGVMAARSDEAAQFLLDQMSREGPGFPSGPRNTLYHAAIRETVAHTRIERLAITALNSSDIQIRANSAILLHEINSKREVFPELSEAVRIARRNTKIDALDALKERGQLDESLSETLRALAKQTDSYLAQRATEALQVIEAEDLP